jgi:uncharacterized membrane protein YeaQ/YmgE (transglycosylase-associated protein family)
MLIVEGADMALWQQTWFVQLVVLIIGAVLVLSARAQRIKRTAAEQLMNEEQLRVSQAQRRRGNWWTVPMTGWAIASLIVMMDEKSGYKASHIVYGVVALAVYTGLVYRWNLGVDDD